MKFLTRSTALALPTIVPAVFSLHLQARQYTSNDTAIITPHSEAQLEEDLGCNPVIPQRTREDEIMLAAIFGAGAEEGMTYADWLLRYGTLLLRQIDDISESALAGDGDDFTSAFETVYTTGILALAKAAPVYSCYLAADPRYVISANESQALQRDQLVALFERHSHGNEVYNYAGLLIDEARDLLLQVNEAVSVAITNSGFVSMFPELNAAFLISFATQAEIYTEGLSEAYESALSSATVADPSMNDTMTIEVSGGVNSTEVTPLTGTDLYAGSYLSITVEGDSSTDIAAVPTRYRYYNTTEVTSSIGAATTNALSSSISSPSSVMSMKSANGASRRFNLSFFAGRWAALLVSVSLATVAASVLM